MCPQKGPLFQNKNRQLSLQITAKSCRGGVRRRETRNFCFCENRAPVYAKRSFSSKNALSFGLRPEGPVRSALKMCPPLRPYACFFRAQKMVQISAENSKRRKFVRPLKNAAPLRPYAGFLRRGGQFPDKVKFMQKRRDQKTSPLCGHMLAFPGSPKTDKSPNGENCPRSPRSVQNGNHRPPEAPPDPPRDPKMTQVGC